MKSICFIVPYFGRFNNYFGLWLNSCANNPTINWLIFTDCEAEYDYPANVKVVHTTFEDLKAHFQSQFDFPISLEKPYKLCDFRPAYGGLFYEYVKDYDFWGYCDTDLVWGDIRSFLTDEVLTAHVKIGVYGHCCIIKNEENNNSMFKKTYKDLPSYKEVFSSSLSYCFDEYCYSQFFIRSGLPSMRLADCFDVCTNYYCFLPAKSHAKDDFPGIQTAAFNYEGKALACFYLNRHGSVIKKNVLYAHFQKRPMKISTSHTARFSIIPNEFIDYIPAWDYGLIKEKAPRRLLYKHFIKWKTKYLLKKLLNTNNPKFFHYK